MALETDQVLQELKTRLVNISSQLSELRIAHTKIEGAIEVLQQIEDSKESEAQDATKSEGDVGESSSVDDESSEGSDSSNSDS
tara:strand:- start:270 stop:518 length:249 start_codon:yes stop_codon:yes gene_type:complete